MASYFECILLFYSFELASCQTSMLFKFRSQSFINIMVVKIYKGNKNQKYNSKRYIIYITDQLLDSHNLIDWYRHYYSVIVYVWKIILIDNSHRKYQTHSKLSATYWIAISRNGCAGIMVNIIFTATCYSYGSTWATIPRPRVP